MSLDLYPREVQLLFGGIPPFLLAKASTGLCFYCGEVSTVIVRGTYGGREKVVVTD